MFIVAFGVIITAILYPKHYGDVSLYDMTHVMSKSYWMTHGKLFLNQMHARSSLTVPPVSRIQKLSASYVL